MIFLPLVQVLDQDLFLLLKELVLTQDVDVQALHELAHPFLCLSQYVLPKLNDMLAPAI